MNGVGLQYLVALRTRLIDDLVTSVHKKQALTGVRSHSCGRWCNWERVAIRVPCG